MSSPTAAAAAGTTACCPKHPNNSQPTKCSMCNAWVNLEKGRNRLALQQERLELDRQLVKAERKNHRRSNQIASQSQGTEIAKLEIQLKTLQQQHGHQMETMQNQLSAAQENGKMQEIEYRLKFQKQQEDAMEEASRRMMQDEAARRFLEENVESLQTKNHEMTQQLEQLEKLKKEQEQEIKRQTDELEDQLKEAKDELEHKSEEATRLTAQLANHASDTLAAQDEMDELQEELTQLRVDKNSSARKIQELESRLQNDPADDDDDDDEAMDELREQLETAQFERENYAMQVRKLDERCKTLESQQSNAVGTAAAAIGGTCANCEDLEEEVYELKLKLNKRQIEFQKELKELKRELEEAQNGGEKTIETVGTAGAAAVVTTKTAKELQEIRQIEVDKRKVEAKFLGLEALQKTTEKEKEAVEAELKETKADLFELAQELEKIQKEHRQVTMQRELDQDAMQEFKSQMDQLQTQQDTYESRLKKDTEEWNTLVDSLGQKQREVFDQTLPEIAKSVDDLEKQLVEVEQIKRKPPAPLPQKPPPAEENADRLDRRHSRRVSERRPPLTKMDSRKNRHVTEFDFQSNKQCGKYTGFLNMMQLPEGHGILRVDNGDVYEGEWENGRRHGQGVYTWYDGDLYTGPWHEGKRHGHGVFVFSDGRLYDGEYALGQREGQGMFVWPYGAKYEGSYDKDKRNGLGEYLYADGRIYRGEYKDDRPHGYGVEVAKDGTVLYDGQWAFGEFVGDGNASVMGSIVDGGRA